MRRAVNIHPDRPTGLILAVLPFILVAAVYLMGSDARLAVNPDDKLMPSLTSIADAVDDVAFTPNRRTGEYIFWTDTLASLERLGWGLGLSTAIGILFGMPIGLVPMMRGLLGSFMAAFSLVPPLAVLPILFIIFGLGEVAKVVLIVFGVAPFLVRDTALRIGQIPHEQLIKAQTLGASTWQMMIHIVLPQAMPRLIDSLRLSLGAAWLFLIAAEAIASEGGLGYRIFLVRRYLSMDVILPYVAWITLLAFLMDLALARLSRTAYRWSHLEQAGAR